MSDYNIINLTILLVKFTTLIKTESQKRKLNNTQVRGL